MSTYVISDIHGCYSLFQEMLRKIRFSSEDLLILAGDYIDRGEENLEMLKWISNHPDNVIVLCGNHDKEFAANIELICKISEIYNIEYDQRSNEDTKKLYEMARYLIQDQNTASYFDYYGTIKSLIYQDRIVQKDLIGWTNVINGMPYYYKLTVNNNPCVIVHAGYIEDKAHDIEQFYLYARDEAYTKGGIKDGIVISGHTPTIDKNYKSYNKGNVFKYFDKERNCIFYNIDCGCSYKERFPDGKLACICIENEKIFYV